MQRPSSHFALLAACALALSGCDCGGPIGGEPCTTNADCEDGLTCRDGTCSVPADATSEDGCEVDEDGDGYGVGCAAGPDCDDTDPVQTGTEICDGADNDCDGVPDEGVMSECGDCNPGCRMGGIGTTPTWDLGVDESDSVGVDEDGSLVLDSRSIETAFIWVSNTAEGTVSKIDTRTREEIARYVTGPAGATNDPSRTSVNSIGDVYVANRGGRTVTKISVLGADCPDSNGDGVVTTSSAGTDVLPWGMDDCVLWNRSLPDGGVLRAVAAQDDFGPDGSLTPYVWIGGWEGIVWRLDGETGDILVRTGSPTNNYGFALDGRGNLWISGRSTLGLGRIDTTRCVDSACDAETICGVDGDTCVKQAIPIPGGHNPYGITVDRFQRIWFASHGTSSIIRYDPLAALSARWVTTNVGINCHGIAADAEGWVWAAGYGVGVVRLHADDPTSIWGVVPGTEGFSAKGMAVDFDGNIWTINLGHNNATVIEPGPSLGDAAVFTNVTPTLVGPYTYSDMTGQQLRLATNPRGWYRRPFEGCTTVEGDTNWLSLRWDAVLPPDTSLLFRARAATTRAGLAAATWVRIAMAPPDGSPADLGAPLTDAGQAGDWIEVEVQLAADRASDTEAITPRLRYMEVTYQCPMELN